MSDDIGKRKEREGSPELSWFQSLVYRIAKKIVPSYASSRMAVESPEYHALEGQMAEEKGKYHALENALQFLEGETAEMQASIYALRDENSSLQNVANALEKKTEELAIALGFQRQAEARSLKATKEMRKMRDITTRTIDEKKRMSRRLACASFEIRWLSAAVEHQRTLSITSHDLIERVREPVFIVGRNNRIVSASPAFLHMAGIKKEQLYEAMPKGIEEVVPSRDIQVGKNLRDLVANTSVVDRFVEVSDYFLPRDRDDYHFSMGIQFPSGKNYLADARIRLSPAAASGAQGWKYDGALFEISRPKGRLLRNVENLLAYFHNQRAYRMPEGNVTKSYIEKVVKDFMLEAGYIEKGQFEDSKYPVLIDFSNADDVEPEAVKAAIGVYDFLEKKGVERYFVVPPRLRDLFFNTGLPGRAMLLPEDASALDAYRKDATEPGLEQGLAQFS